MWRPCETSFIVWGPLRKLHWSIEDIAVVVEHPDSQNQLHLVFRKRKAQALSTEIWHKNIQFSTGAKWKSRRKLLTPCFHFRILEDFMPIFNDNSLILVRKLRTLQNEEYVDIMSLIVLCTLDIVCETVMGARIGAQSGENPDYVKAVHKVHGFMRSSPHSYTSINFIQLEKRLVRPDNLFPVTNSPMSVLTGPGEA
ncbi:cytochrome P450 4V2 [Trichonephila clavipes]|nr:cytochrome P450 4V2 [Trichonephila clavipes]